MSQQASSQAPPEQELAYARDLRRVYERERARRRELEAANAELDRRIVDLLAAQDWILAVNSTRDLPALVDLLAQPLVLLLRARTTMIFPRDPQTGILGAVLGHGFPAETPPLVALRDSPLTQAMLTAERLWEASDLEAVDAAAPDFEVARALGWRALAALPLVARGERVGLLYVAWSEPHSLDERERTLLDLLGQHAAVALANGRLQAESRARTEGLQRAEQQLVHYARDLRQAYDRERARRRDVQAAYVATVKLLAAAIETRDPYTGGHVERVSGFSLAIGRELGLDDEQLGALEIGALLHDVGKIGVPDAVLRKPGRLDPDEWALMSQHPAMGARMLREVPFLQGTLGCVLRHQERYDGSGYPDGLIGQTIPIEARIVAVADTFDAMTTDRPYRKGLPASTALAEIERCAGTQFDPTIVATFLQVVQAGAITASSG